MIPQHTCAVSKSSVLWMATSLNKQKWCLWIQTCRYFLYIWYSGDISLPLNNGRSWETMWLTCDISLPLEDARSPETMWLTCDISLLLEDAKSPETMWLTCDNHVKPLFHLKLLEAQGPCDSQVFSLSSTRRCHRWKEIITWTVHDKARRHVRCKFTWAYDWAFWHAVHIYSLALVVLSPHTFFSYCYLFI